MKSVVQKTSWTPSIEVEMEVDGKIVKKRKSVPEDKIRMVFRRPDPASFAELREVAKNREDVLFAWGRRGFELALLAISYEEMDDGCSEAGLQKAIDAYLANPTAKAKREKREKSPTETANAFKTSFLAANREEREKIAMSFGTSVESIMAMFGAPTA